MKIIDISSLRMKKFKDQVEITELYDNYQEIVNTATANTVSLSDKQGKPPIFLNGVIITTIPRIDFDLSKDEIYANGAFVVADYLDEYCDGPAFYREADKWLPILFFVGDEPINITLEDYEDGSMVCRVDQERSSKLYND